MAPAKRGRPLVGDGPEPGDRCVLCDELMLSRKDSCKVGRAGIQTLLECSRKYSDNFHVILVGVEHIWLHTKCRSKYVNHKTRVSPFLSIVNRRQGLPEDTPAEPTRTSLRSDPNRAHDFDPKIHCLLCGEVADLKRRETDKTVRRVMTSDDFETAIRKECDRRKLLNDKWGVAVALRVEHTALIGLDFPAAEVRYHQKCSVRFRSGRGSHLSSQGIGRPVGTDDIQKHQNFLKLCDHIEKKDECQYTLGELHAIMADLTDDDSTYSCKHLKTKLIEHYGRGVLISGEAGASQIVNFTGFLTKLLYDNWYNDRRDSETEERFRIIKLAASFLLEDIRSQICNMNVYPPKESMVASELPVSLRFFLDSLITTKGENEEKINRRKRFLGEGIMYSCRPKSYLPPALLALSTDLHRRYASRELNDALNAKVTYRDVCQEYVKYTTQLGARVTVVFDGYEVRWSTKCEEQQRRAEGRVKASPDIDVDDDKIVTHVREDFLCNNRNKSSLIRLLRQHLHAAGVNTKQADADADTMIAEEALIAATSCTVTVIAKDTDIVAILIARGCDGSTVTVKSPGAGGAADRVFSIGAIRQQLGEMTDCVLVAHAFTGCDTTSAIFRKGKLKAWDILKHQEDLRGAARTFNNPSAVKEDIVRCGEKLLMALYPKVKGVSTLDDLRYYEYGRLVAKKSAMHVPLLADLPPTSEGGRQHSLRVYLTVQGWLGNALDPTEWGWFRGDRSLHPVPSSLQPAPEELLNLVACNCKAGCREGSGCSCRKANLTCSSSCGACRGEMCSNTVEGDEADWESF